MMQMLITAAEKKMYATPTCRNDFWQSVAEIVVVYLWADILDLVTGADILDLVTGHVLSRSLREYENQCIHIVYCFGKRGNSRRQRVQYHCNLLMTSFTN